MATVSVPVTVSPEAQSRLNFLGLHAEFERMLDYVRQNMPGLRSIDVVLEPPYDTGGDDVILIQPLILEREPGQPDRAHAEWWEWFRGSFPNVICLNFCLFPIYYPAEDGR